MMSKRLLRVAIAYQACVLAVIAGVEAIGAPPASPGGRAPFPFWFAIVAAVAAGPVILAVWQLFVVGPVPSRAGRILLWVPVALSMLTAVRYLAPLDGRLTIAAFYAAVAVTTGLVVWLSWRVRRACGPRGLPRNLG